MKYQGVFTALVTPLDERGQVDEAALKRLVDQQIQAGITGFVPMGTTGESPTLDYEEHLKVIEQVTLWSQGRVPIIAGTGSNSTDEALMLTRRAKALGVQASLQVVPYYNKPSQEGLYRHFSTIADQIDLPMIVYNIAGRTGKNLETDTLMRLAQHPNIVGVKEASGDLGQMMEVLARRPEGFAVLSGDDNLTLPLIALGGDGVISVASHLIPGPMVALVQAALAGDFAQARTLHFQHLALFKNLFIDTNPIPVKTALALQGRMNASFRLPLCPMDEAKLAVLRQTLTDLHLLEVQP